jgi:ribosomal protein S18 acetylase RimI-like enzyme
MANEIVHGEENFVIRKMKITDYDEVNALWLATEGMGLNNLDDTREGIQKYLARNPNTCFVAEKSGEIVGVILSGHDGRRALIYHLAVLQKEQCGGIGTALLHAAINALKDEGINKVYIIVLSANENGHAFWEKRGFVIPNDSIYRAKEIVELTHLDTKC